MQLLSELFHALRDPTTLITTVGTVGAGSPALVF